MGSNPLLRFKLPWLPSRNRTTRSKRSSPRLGWNQTPFRCCMTSTLWNQSSLAGALEQPCCWYNQKKETAPLTRSSQTSASNCSWHLVIETHQNYMTVSSFEIAFRNRNYYSIVSSLLPLRQPIALRHFPRGNSKLPMARASLSKLRKLPTCSVRTRKVLLAQL